MASFLFMAKSLNQLKADAKAEGWSEWIRSEADERAMLNGCWFDVAAGKAWCGFLEKWFRFTRGTDIDGNSLIGKPYTLIPYQRDELIMPLFGWKRDRARPHLRRFTKGDIFVAKKQAKSTISAAICNAFLLKGPARTEIYGVAHSREQTGVIYREAAAFARKSPELAKRLKAVDTHKRIVFEQKGSFYQALAGENGARSAEGIIPSLILFDEIHVQRDRMLYDSLAYACIASENSLFLSVSTVGVADRTTIWWEQYEYARGIIDGSLKDDSRFAYIAQADEGCKDSPEMRADPAQWRKAMPALGITVKEEAVAAAVREAENSPAKLNNLLRYVFNIPTSQAERVIPMDKWDACGGANADSLQGQVCYAGLDIGATSDFTAFVLVFPHDDAELVVEPTDELDAEIESGKSIVRRSFSVLAWFWLPEEPPRRDPGTQESIDLWTREGFIKRTPGNVVDYDAVLDDIQEIARSYSLAGIGFDRGFQGSQTGNNLMKVYGDLVEQVPQGILTMNAPFREMIELIMVGRLHHDGNPVLRWMASNTAAETRGGLMKPSKEHSKDKIDGIASLVMALCLAIRDTGKVEFVSMYSEPGNLVL
jgi:phage terminase large subunit-like protein